MSPLILYMHAGSGNHGCEAIADALVRLCGEEKERLKPILLSNNVSQDRQYMLGQLEEEGRLTLVEEQHIAAHLMAHVTYYGWRKITGDAESFLRYRYRTIRSQLKKRPEGAEAPVAISIGGDNYCYPEMVGDLALSNRVFRRAGCRTVLLGCSVEPETVPSLQQDLMNYERIIARESITWQGLVEGGIPEERLSLVPDPAFTLETVPVSLSDAGLFPAAYQQAPVVGINLSPMARDLEQVPGITMRAYERLIRDILGQTDMNIALIPHVVWLSNDDRGPLTALYETFRETGRVALVADAPARVLKGTIAACRFFIGARTHATIAAYSSLVPTLVLGYSVKSRGIARDLFPGQEEGLVLPVQGLSREEEISRAFFGLMEREEPLRTHLAQVMPEVIARACGVFGGVL